MEWWSAWMIWASVVNVFVPAPPSLLLWLVRTTPTTAPVTARVEGALNVTKQDTLTLRHYGCLQTCLAALAKLSGYLDT
jgi:hypothetical protein